VWVRIIKWPHDEVRPGELSAWELRDGVWWGNVVASREWVPGMPMPEYRGWVPASRISKRE
jgi:hypothetical protein